MSEVISLIKEKVCFGHISVQNCLALFLWACYHRRWGQEECAREGLFTSWEKKDTDRHGPGSQKSSQKNSSGGLLSSQLSKIAPAPIITSCGTHLPTHRPLTAGLTLSEERTNSIKDITWHMTDRNSWGSSAGPSERSCPTKKERRGSKIYPLTSTHTVQVHMTTLTSIPLSPVQ